MKKAKAAATIGLSSPKGYFKQVLAIQIDRLDSKVIKDTTIVARIVPAIVFTQRLQGG
ncbi:hypothetical protein [Bradyrhizobium acaciae]|uniref:hypothetical protein n=1 Tax=Bradyrhizobium acaciae TaxID=2683706 RepID=UPI001E395372|nr:hypothetical protein [Bradyrhizobium acaciae]MCC8978543.1 hypothetical protein [Bradyrhizobium acaciae]